MLFLMILTVIRYDTSTVNVPQDIELKINQDFKNALLGLPNLKNLLKFFVTSGVITQAEIPSSIDEQYILASKLIEKYYYLMAKINKKSLEVFALDLSKEIPDVNKFDDIVGFCKSLRLYINTIKTDYNNKKSDIEILSLALKSLNLDFSVEDSVIIEELTNENNNEAPTQTQINQRRTEKRNAYFGDVLQSGLSKLLNNLSFIPSINNLMLNGTLVNFDNLSTEIQNIFTVDNQYELDLDGLYTSIQTEFNSLLPIINSYNILLKTLGETGMTIQIINNITQNINDNQTNNTTLNSLSSAINPLLTFFGINTSELTTAMNPSFLLDSYNLWYKNLDVGQGIYNTYGDILSKMFLGSAKNLSTIGTAIGWFALLTRIIGTTLLYLKGIVDSKININSKFYSKDELATMLNFQNISSLDDIFQSISNLQTALDIVFANYATDNDINYFNFFQGGNITKQQIAGSKTLEIQPLTDISLIDGIFISPRSASILAFYTDLKNSMNAYKTDITGKTAKIPYKTCIKTQVTLLSKFCDQMALLYNSGIFLDTAGLTDAELTALCDPNKKPIDYNTAQYKDIFSINSSLGSACYTAGMLNYDKLADQENSRLPDSTYRFFGYVDPHYVVERSKTMLLNAPDSPTTGQTIKENIMIGLLPMQPWFPASGVLFGTTNTFERSTILPNESPTSYLLYYINSPGFTPGTLVNEFNLNKYCLTINSVSIPSLVRYNILMGLYIVPSDGTVNPANKITVNTANGSIVYTVENVDPALNNMLMTKAATNLAFGSVSAGLNGSTTQKSCTFEGVLSSTGILASQMFRGTSSTFNPYGVPKASTTTLKGVTNKLLGNKQIYTIPVEKSIFGFTTVVPYPVRNSNGIPLLYTFGNVRRFQVSPKKPSLLLSDGTQITPSTVIMRAVPSCYLYVGPSVLTILRYLKNLSMYLKNMTETAVVNALTLATNTGINQSDSIKQCGILTSQSLKLYNAAKLDKASGAPFVNVLACTNGGRVTNTSNPPYVTAKELNPEYKDFSYFTSEFMINPYTNSIPTFTLSFSSDVSFLSTTNSIPYSVTIFNCFDGNSLSSTLTKGFFYPRDIMVSNEKYFDSVSYKSIASLTGFTFTVTINSSTATASNYTSYGYWDPTGKKISTPSAISLYKSLFSGNFLSGYVSSYKFNTTTQAYDLLSSFAGKYNLINYFLYQRYNMPFLDFAKYTTSYYDTTTGELITTAAANRYLNDWCANPYYTDTAGVKYGGGFLMAHYSGGGVVSSFGNCSLFVPDSPNQADAF